MMGGNNNNGISSSISTNNNSNTESNPNSSKYVTEIRATDVLFGRGSGPNDHIGNIRFRQYVAERKSQYMSTNHRLTKTKIAREIVTMVLQENGRFVKKVEPQELNLLGLPENMEYYELVDDETIMEKAKQALRQNQNAAMSANKTSTGALSPISLEPNPVGISSSSNINTTLLVNQSVPKQQQKPKQQQQRHHSVTSSGVTIKVDNLSSDSTQTNDTPYSLNDDRANFRVNEASYDNLFRQPPHPQQHYPQQHHSGVHHTSGSTTTTAMMTASSEDLAVSYNTYDLEPLPLNATSNSQLPLDCSSTAGSSSNNMINHNDDVSRTASTTDAWNNSYNIFDSSNNPPSRRHSDTTEYYRYQQQQQRLKQLQEQQQMLNFQQQQLQMQMAAVFGGTMMDDTTPISLHQQQPHQRASSVLLQEQQALLLRKQQQQQQQELQIEAAIRSLDTVYPNTARTANHNIDHSNYNSSMAQLPHEDVSSFSTKRNSIRVEDLVNVRATVAASMSAHHDVIDHDPSDHLLSQLPGEKNMNATATANNNQVQRYLTNMNSMNMSMSLRHIDHPGAVDDLMGSFNQMKTPSMEVNLDYPNGESHNNINDNKNKNNHSSIMSQEQRNKMMASTETMGTIEHIGSTADMSILMGSSTFSLFRHGNESSAVMEESGTTGTTTSTSGATAGSLMQRGGGSSMQLPLHRQNSNSQFLSSAAMLPSMASKSSSKTSSSLESNNSFNVSDIFAKSSSNMNSNYNSSMAFVTSDVRRQIEEEDVSDININDSTNYLFDQSGMIATLPRTIGVMLEVPDETNTASNQNSAANDLDLIGSSSLAVLQSALFQSTNTEIQDGDNNDPNSNV